MKYTLLAASVSLLLSACVSTTTSTQPESAATQNSAIPQQVKGDEVVNPNIDTQITLEKVMSDPDWMGRAPEQWYWGDDSNTIFYQQKREGNPTRDLFSKSLAEQGNGDKVNYTTLHKVADKGAVQSADGSKELYVFKGNVFLKDLQAKSVSQLTHTSAVETQPMFLTNGDIAYRAGNVFYSLNLTTGQLRELANLKMTNTPGKAKAKTYIAKEQHKLIKFVALQERNATIAADKEQDIRDVNDTIATSTFYFGEGKRVVQAQLSPTGDKLIVSVAKDMPWSKPEDIMPNYITSDAMIDPQRVRYRVSDNRQYQEQVYLLDLVNDAQYLLGFDSLPGFDEDVLASVRKENYARDGKTYESKKAPRNIHLMQYQQAIKWHKDGEHVAVMLEAWDNKDRWIATIDFDNKTLVNQHRLHDDAWINWDFNDFGWFNNSATLYYLSEESGYGHLYVKPIDGKAKALTSGRYEVRQLTKTQDESSFYFQANKKHPGIYEVYKVDVDTAKVTAVTDLGGNNSYALSPDETKLLIEHSTTTMPPELYVQNLRTKMAPTRVTYTVSDEFLAMPWTAPTVVEIPSKHSEQGIYSRVYQPKEQTGPNAGKAVMFVHGAGYLQNSHLGWSGYFREFMFHSMLVQQGYTVIDMDYRASKGYGRDWRTAIYRHMGKPEVEDMLTGVDWLVANADIDKDKVGVYGGSYGGFLTLMALFKEPDTFAAGSALRLVSDWTSYNHGYTSNILNTPGDDPIAFERSSPIYFAEGLTKPLLINAPMVDDNVFFQDSVRLVQRLIELEKENWETAIYPVEPHGFVQPSSWLDEYRRIYKLFETHL
ncbi:prolyl oligopeptidase family serine peptidase [Thalassotalea ponticola]|uniref:S9 family peptidase n=1 Tax=Thalassotalea ponticola TaxID=1523392 RepID=UPI0025B4E875|nr:prolyl oligopeptidase family serine peptidase [Thalassotalea ponticola]MDN3651617.1 prolyl oligopeptidase family serine peptidase [Thalassotalea ponticola]